MMPETNLIPDVYRAICQVATVISKDGITKSKKNEQQGYKFRGIDDVYNSLSAVMAGAGLCILPRMSDRTHQERSTKSGSLLFYVTVRADFDFVSSKDGSKHTVTMYGEAMDSADKATNKAMSAAYKYACLQVFCIPTEGMGDADATTHEVYPPPGSDKAAQEVARQKIDGLRPLLNGASDGDLVPALEASIAQAEEKKAKRGPKPYDKFKMFEAFEEVKKRFLAIGREDRYRAVLGRYGAKKRTDLSSENNGRQAKDCYKDLTLEIADLEAEAAIAKEQQEDLSRPVEYWEDKA